MSGQEISVRVYDQRDIDETRRLLYGAMVASRTKRWELVGTLVNALVHHSRIESDPVALADRLVAMVESGRAAEALGLIARLSGPDSAADDVVHDPGETEPGNGETD